MLVFPETEAAVDSFSFCSVRDCF